MVTFRNALIHHKTRREPYEIGSVAPVTEQRLGLDPETAGSSVESVSAMIEALATLLGEPPQPALSSETDFFRFEIERRRLR